MRFLIALAFVLVSGNALACSCGDADMKSIIDSSTHIFVAEIIAVSKNEHSEHRLDEIVAEFEVEETIKGSPEELSQLNSGYGGGDCGIPFLVGHSMLIFTSDGTISMCGASRSYHAYGDDEYLRLLKRYVSEGIQYDFEEYPAFSAVWVRCDEREKP